MVAWSPQNHPRYDQILEPLSQATRYQLIDDPSARSSFMHDTRDTHRVLYKDITPQHYDHYAGTYRGDVGTNLVHRKVSSPSFFKPGESYEFADPADVQNHMNDLHILLVNYVSSAKSQSRDWVITNCSRILYYFGVIHPFLDGNGHIQRLIFASLVAEAGLQLSDKWTIHKRPYDALLGMAFEAQALGYKFGPDPSYPYEGLDLISEYISIFIL